MSELYSLFLFRGIVEEELVSISPTSAIDQYSGTVSSLRFRLCSSGSCCLTPLTQHSDSNEPGKTMAFEGSALLGDCQGFSVNTQAEVQVTMYVPVSTGYGWAKMNQSFSFINSIILIY